ncbi:uncharacterized protein VNE69_10155 [Vairimorpha necatrix]|uniref:Ribosomal protein S10 n=1 Tax=Vairimorpha necatrix TaxID=6039 RepID=A0AAX4JFK3_9MICR
MKLQDIFKIHLTDDLSKQRSMFLSIQIPDVDAVRDTKEYSEYLRLSSKFQTKLTRRVSWDTPLYSIKEIEGRRKKIKKYNVLYDFDLKKVRTCDKERVLEILTQLHNNKSLL